jgi:hypothetical protein
VAPALPGPIAVYFRSRAAPDIDASVAAFSAHAVVTDEQQDHRGRAAIRSWIEETTRKYQPTLEPQDARDADGETIVSVRVSGIFPGSPILLDFAFTLAGDEIARLHIG